MVKFTVSLQTIKVKKTAGMCFMAWPEQLGTGAGISGGSGVLETPPYLLGIRIFFVSNRKRLSKQRKLKKYENRKRRRTLHLPNGIAYQKRDRLLIWLGKR